ncbi:MAG TPA: DUF559 domain-containing protein [Gemmatimonadaceae bacterium]|nr:DUF559 domain-containing protein [Gemmatimonadaceae bacterium]
MIDGLLLIGSSNYSMSYRDASRARPAPIVRASGSRKPQRRTAVGNRVFVLDRSFEAELVAVELDGAAYHGAPGQRERDLRRDAALARLGWLTVRYSHPRLHGDAGGVIEELADILARRRKQLRRPA